MRLEDAEVGQPVRLVYGGADRVGQVYAVRPDFIWVYLFSSLHREWIIKPFRPEQLEPVPEEGD